MPLVLITGSSSTMAEWDPRLTDPLARHHRVIVFDNRGAGTSTGSMDELTIALMARDTEQLIATVAGGRADVRGHRPTRRASMGYVRDSRFAAPTKGSS